jgi:hypothetical protein
MTGIPWQSISVDGSTSTAAGGAGTEPTATERAAELQNASVARTIYFRADPDQPIIRISTQGPNPAQATSLAQASVDALIRYIENLQEEQNVAGGRRVRLIQIGRPSGGLINESADLAMAGVAAVVVFGFGCFLILFVPSVFRGFQAAKALDASLSGAPGTPGPGAGAESAETSDDRIREWMAMSTPRLGGSLRENDHETRGASVRPVSEGVATAKPDAETPDDPDANGDAKKGVATAKPDAETPDDPDANGDAKSGNLKSRLTELRPWPKRAESASEPEPKRSSTKSEP